MSEQMSDSLSAEEIMVRIRERVRLRKQAGNGNAIVVPVAPNSAPRERAAGTVSLYDLSEMHRNAADSNNLWNQVGTINPRRSGVHNDLIQLLKRALRRALMWYTRPLDEFHGSVVRTLNETARALENLQQNVAATSKLVDSVANAQNSLIVRLDTAEASNRLVIRELGERLDRTEQLQTHMLEERVRLLEERLRLSERNFRRVAYMLEQKSQRKGGPEVSPETPPMFRSDIPSESEFDYLLFEERFRGSENDIKDRQRRYIDIFQGRQNVIDLGCGRGEFLELMQENKVPARGVESNTDMFLLCREKGLEVLQENLFDYLESVPDASIGGIFCSQVIEHLPSGLQIRLVALSNKKLKPGSPLVIETINPECLLALSRNFFLDPTHVRPVHPEMLRFLLESLHFEKVEFQFSAPANLGESIPKLTLPHAATDLVRFNQVLEQMNGLLFGCQDYTVVGYR
jgi:SAM-dependent methyltransferase